MSGFFLTTYVLLWVLVIILTLLVLLLYRQYGQSVLPAKARMQLAGLDLGKPLPEFDVLGADGEPAGMHSLLASRRGLQVLLFASPGCPICESLWPQVGSLGVGQPEVTFWWVASGRSDDQPSAGDVPPGWSLVYTADVGQHAAGLELPVLPYAYAVDDAGVIRSKGLMNELGDFEHLIDAGRGKPATESLALLDAGATNGHQPEN